MDGKRSCNTTRQVRYVSSAMILQYKVVFTDSYETDSVFYTLV